MKSICLARTRVYVCAIMAALTLSPALISPASSANNQPTAQMPDVLLWVDARIPGKNWVSITYPKVVPRAAAEKRLAELLEETGWSASNIDVSDSSIMKSGDFPMTSVEFMTSATIRSDGALPVGPVIKAFRDVNRIEMQYLVPSGYYFHGVTDFENKYVQIKFIGGNSAYRYSIRIKDGSFATLDLPSSTPTRANGTNTGFGLIVGLLVGMLALLAAAAAFMLTTRFTQKNRQTHS